MYGGTWYDDDDEPPDSRLTVRAGIPGPWSERLPHFRLDAQPSAGGDELQTEYFLDRRHAVGALRAVRGLGHRISPHLHAAEIRTTAADDVWLSPAYERDSLCIGFTWRRHPREVMALLPDIEAALEPFEPRPHWAKLFVFDDTDLSRRVPRLPDFLELITTYEPDWKVLESVHRSDRRALERSLMWAPVGSVAHTVTRRHDGQPTSTLADATTTSTTATIRVMPAAVRAKRRRRRGVQRVRQP